MRSYRRSGLLGIVFVTVLLGTATSSALDPASALACTPTNNPDGSHTCTDVQMVPCPTMFGGTTSGYSAVFIPVGRIDITHNFSLPCPGSGLSETFDPDAPDPPPPTGDQTARVDFTATCNSMMGGCAGGTQAATFTVNYKDPPSGGGDTGGGGSAPQKPDATDLLAPPRVWVGKQGEAEVPFDVDVDHISPDNYDMTDWFLFAFTGAHPVKPKSRSMAVASRTKKVTVGTLSDAHFAPGQRSAIVQLNLNGKGRKALRALGKLSVTAQGNFGNSAGSIRVTKKLKLVAKK